MFLNVCKSGRVSRVLLRTALKRGGAKRRQARYRAPKPPSVERSQPARVCIRVRGLRRMSVRSVGACVCSSLPGVELSAARRSHNEPNTSDRLGHAPKGGAITAAVVALGVSMITMAALDTASAQQAETELPGITVEGGGAKKKSAAKKAAAPAPAPAPSEPATSADSEAARLDAPYDTPAGVSVVGQGEISTFGQVRLDDVMR